MAMQPMSCSTGGGASAAASAATVTRCELSARFTSTAPALALNRISLPCATDARRYLLAPSN
jgi:hypothetical protein